MPRFLQEHVEGEITLAIGNPPAVSRGVRLPGFVLYTSKSALRPCKFKTLMLLSVLSDEMTRFFFHNFVLWYCIDRKTIDYWKCLTEALQCRFVHQDLNRCFQEVPAACFARLRLRPGSRIHGSMAAPWLNSRKTILYIAAL